MAAKKKQTFEDRLQELEQLISGMEAGTGSLEEMLQAYDTGMRMAKGLEEELAQASQRLTVLRQGEEEPLQLDEEEDEDDAD